MPARRQPTHGHPYGAVCVHCERDYGPAALADLAEQHKAENVLVWMLENEQLIVKQIELRARFPDRPRSNGAAERLVAQVDERLGKRRRNFRNARRLNTVVRLMAVEMRGDADPLTLARVVRDVIESGTAPHLLGDPGMDRGALVNDPAATSVGSIASLLLSGGQQRKAANRAYWVSAKTRSNDGQTFSTSSAPGVDYR